MNRYLEKLSKDLECRARSEWLYRELTQIKNAMLNGRFYIRVESVSRTGMSRVVSMAYIHQNKLIHIHQKAILGLAGCDKNGRIGGCGMDMLFAAQYNLFASLCPNHRYQDSMRRYNEL